MPVIRDFLEQHLHPLAGPYLFVGAGFSRRYASLPSWRELLTHFAEPTGMPLPYYESGTLPEAATKLEEAFREHWFRSDEYADSRAMWQEKVAGSMGLPLKVEVSRYLDSLLEDFEPPESLKLEWDLFTQSTIDGVITTNYDGLLARAFPGYRIYVGQEGLLFSDPQGIAEIYAIHGTTSDPGSLVLDSDDYADYEARNSYLAAKLLTVFVEHPVIFIGYSFNDPNIHQILRSLVKGLRDKSVEKLQDRLIFVEWSISAEPSIERTQMSVGGQLLPVIRIVTPDWTEVFAALGVRQHALNARTLRILKEQVYEIVRTNDPTDRLYAYKDIDDETANELSIVFGVGAKVAAVGIVGIKREDIIADVLGTLPGGFPADEVIERHIAAVPLPTWYPVYKYLREAGQLTEKGEIEDTSQVPTKVLAREKKNRAKIVTHVRYRRKHSMRNLLERHDWRWIYKNIFEIPSYTDDIEGFRSFLESHPEKNESSPWWITQHAKGVVVYDYWAYRLPHPSKK